MTTCCHFACFEAASFSLRLTTVRSEIIGTISAAPSSNGLLNDHIHVFPFRNRLRQGDSTRLRPGLSFLKDVQTHFPTSDFANLGR